MAVDDGTDVVHRVAYIFQPSDGEDGHAGAETKASRRGRKHPRGRRETAAGTPAKKRRRVSGDDGNDDNNNSDKAREKPAEGNTLAAFPTLLQGRETPAAVMRRRQLYADTWADLDGRIQTVLQRSNQATLDAVAAFIEKPVGAKLPAAFVILGPAATTDMLLFRQLADRLEGGDDDGPGPNRNTNTNTTAAAKPRIRHMVRLRSAEASNLRAVLKTIVQVATTAVASSADDGDDEIGGETDGHYLAYDLEAVCAAVRGRDVRIVISFEDSEAFDSGLLADLLAYLHSWLDRIPFVLLFGVATSVDLFQARLPKTAAHRLAAAQFDVAPSSAVLDRLVRRAVAAADVPLRIGPGLLRSLAERQDEQVAGVSVFVNSLKYAYMSYFYANALSVLLSGSDDDVSAYLDEPGYCDALRQLPSFRRYVEAQVEADHRPAAAQAMRLLLTDDKTFRRHVLAQMRRRRRWTTRLLRALHLATASGAFADQSFTELYISVLEHGGGGGVVAQADGSDAQQTEDTIAATLTHAIHRMSAAELVALIRRLIAAVQTGDAELGLAPAAEVESKDDDEEEEEDGHDTWPRLVGELGKIADEVEVLQRKVEEENENSRGRRGGMDVGSHSTPQLRSKYTAQSRVLRTTVVAQKVQLSRDSAALTAADQAFTELVDRVVSLVAAELDVEGANDDDSDSSDSSSVSSPPSLWLHEVWLYDARSPYRDVFVPRPGLVLERALLRPHDYLACSCCGRDGRDGRNDDGGHDSIRPTLPPTAILYQLYREAGTLINVADLWAAFQAVVGDVDEDDELERRHLVQFYQALAELKAAGFVKATRKKADHVAKVKWL